MFRKISMSPAILSIVAGVGAGAAVAQTSDDAALKNMNACLAGANSTTERDFMTRLNPALNDPDRVPWCLFLYVNSKPATTGNNNALFETWATDNDTFQTNPAWPAPGASEKALRAIMATAVPEVIKLTPATRPSAHTALLGQAQIMRPASSRSERPLASIQPHELGITSR
jgi:hypothetical protein